MHDHRGGAQVQGARNGEDPNRLDYDALIAHTTIVFMRYMFLALECRMATDQIEDRLKPDPQS